MGSLFLEGRLSCVMRDWNRQENAERPEYRRQREKSSKRRWSSETGCIRESGTVRGNESFEGAISDFGRNPSPTFRTANPALLCVPRKLSIQANKRTTDDTDGTDK